MNVLLQMIEISLINDVTYTATFINERRHLLKNVEGAIQIIRHILGGSVLTLF